MNLHDLVPAALLLAAGVAMAAKPFPDSVWPRVRPGRHAWMAHPDVKMYVRWVRTSAGNVPQWEVRDGVCVIYMADGTQLALKPGDRLLEGCWASGRTSIAGPRPPGAVLLHWYRLPNRGAVQQRYDDLFGANGPLGFFTGFYWHPDPDGPCHIFTARDAQSAGHEFKHCVDGAFHYPSGTWRTVQ